MKRLSLLLISMFAALLLCSCASKDAAPAGSPHATVRMRDGSTVTGTVLSSSATEIKLAGDDNVARTIPMAQVRMVDYGDVAAAPPVAPGAPPPPLPPPSDVDPVHEQHYHPPAAAITTKSNVLAVGTKVPVRTEETIDSAKAREGQTFAAEVTRDIRDADGDVVIPRGANARIIIRSAAKGGKFHGASDLILDLDSVAIDGRQYRLSTTDLAQKGRDGVGVNRRTGEFAGGGAAIGAIIGAIAGGGKGAAIGAGSGAGAGTATEILTKGGSVKVPVESVLTFSLDRPLRVVESN
jgi:hypothetical protein